MADQPAADLGAPQALEPINLPITLMITIYHMIDREQREDPMQLSIDWDFLKGYVDPYNFPILAASLRARLKLLDRTARIVFEMGAITRGEGSIFILEDVLVERRAQDDWMGYAPIISRWAMFNRNPFRGVIPLQDNGEIEPFLNGILCADNAAERLAVLFLAEACAVVGLHPDQVYQQVVRHLEREYIE